MFHDILMILFSIVYTKNLSFLFYFYMKLTFLVIVIFHNTAIKSSLKYYSSYLRVHLILGILNLKSL